MSQSLFRVIVFIEYRLTTMRRAIAWRLDGRRPTLSLRRSAVPRLPRGGLCVFDEPFLVAVVGVLEVLEASDALAALAAPASSLTSLRGLCALCGSDVLLPAQARWHMAGTSRQNPRLGRYSTRSASTKPTFMNSPDAGTNGAASMNRQTSSSALNRCL